MIITTTEKLQELVDLIHDYWFNVEQIVVDREKGWIALRVEPTHSALLNAASEGMAIVIRNVEDVEIKDTQKVRDYDINDITYDSTSRSIRIIGGIPIEIVVRVQSLEIVIVDNE